MESSNFNTPCTSIPKSEHDYPTAELKDQYILRREKGAEEEDGKFRLYISPVGRENRSTIFCEKGDTVTTLIGRIRKEFDLTKDSDILIYERVEIPGSISRPLEYDKVVHECSKKDLVFHVKGTKPDLSRLEEFCCRQNIAIVGSPSHGKSSTINTMSKSLRRDTGTPISQTYSIESAGTKPYTKHELYVNQSSFRLWDVPGQDDSGDLKNTFLSIFQGRETPDHKIGQDTRSISRHHLKIHTVVVIQKGTANIEKLPTIALSSAKESGRGIPVFIIITHLDKITQASLASVKEELSNLMGLDQNVMFPLANDDFEDSYAPEDPQKKQYVISMLEKVLEAAKVHKEMLGNAGLCEFQ